MTKEVKLVLRRNQKSHGKKMVVVLPPNLTEAERKTVFIQALYLALKITSVSWLHIRGAEQDSIFIPPADEDVEDDAIAA